VARIDYDEYVRAVKRYRLENRGVTSGHAHLTVLAEVDEAAARYVEGSAMDTSVRMGRETVLLGWLRKRWA